MEKDLVQVSLTKKQYNNLMKGKGVVLKKDSLMQDGFNPVEVKPIKPIKQKPPMKLNPVEKPMIGLLQKEKTGLGSQQMTFQKGHPMTKSASGFRPPGAY